MTTPKWIDTTNYELGETADEKKARAWNIKVECLYIRVRKDTTHNPGYWTMDCPALHMEEVDLKLPSDQDAELAQGIAINLVKNKLRELAASLSKIGK